MLKIILIIIFTTCIVSLIWLMVLRKEIETEIALIDEHEKEIKDYKKNHYEQIRICREINDDLIRKIENYKTKGEKQC